MAVSCSKVEKLEAEIEVQCSADKFYRMFKHDVKDISKHIPHCFPHVEILEGDGINVGCVKSWDYVLEEGGRCLNVKERTTVLDDEKRMVTHSFFEGEVMNDYKFFEITLVVTPKEGVHSHGSLVKWIVEYEKAKEDAPAPTAYIEFVKRVTKDLNSKLHHLGHSHKHHSHKAHPHKGSNVEKLEAEIEVQCSAEKFYRMFKHDVKDISKHIPHCFPHVEILEGDGINVGCVKSWDYVLEEGGRCLNVKERTTVLDDEKRMVTHSFFEGEVMNDYKFFEITLVVTPKEGGHSHGSLVKWIVEYEKAKEDAPEPTAYIEFVKRLTKDLNSKLHHLGHSHKGHPHKGSNVEKLETEIEVQCSADKFYRMFKHDVKDISKHIPHCFPHVEILEGDGISVGCVKSWDYVLEEGGRCLNVKERTTVLDDEKRMVTHSFFEGEVMNDYKFFEITLVVTPKEGGHSHGSLVKWIVEYEKAKEDAPEPTAYIEFVKRLTKDLNSKLHHLGHSHKGHPHKGSNVEKLETEIEVQCSADKFYRMFKHDVKDISKHIPHCFPHVEILEGDGISVGCVKSWDYVLEEGGRCLNVKERTTVLDDEKRMVTHSFFEGEVMNDYKFFEITLVVTPKEGGHSHGSLVKWIVEYEKAKEDAPEPTAYIEFVKRLTKDLNSKLHHLGHSHKGHPHKGSNVEKLETEIEVQCSADKFYRMFKHDVKDISKHIPHCFPHVEILEGDGISVGCVKSWDYVLEEGGRCLNVKERTTVLDDEKRMVTHSFFEGEVMNDYKFFEITLVVTPKEGGHSHGSLVKWIVEYEKAKEDAPEPTAYIEFVKRLTKDLNSKLHHLGHSHKVHPHKGSNVEKLEAEIEVQCSAEKFYRMFKHDVKDISKHIPHCFPHVKILEGDGISVGCVKSWDYVLEEGGRCLNVKERTTVLDDEKRMVTHSFFEGEVMNDYKFFEITLVVTPKEGGHSHGSLVKWIVEYEKAKEDAPAPTAYIEFVKRVTKDLNSKLHHLGHSHIGHSHKGHPHKGSNVEKLEAEIEVQCSAENFYRMFKHDVKDISKHIPHHFQQVKILEGDGISVGTVKHWYYVLEEGGRCLNAKERTRISDEKKRLSTHSFFEGELMKDYKFFEITLIVTPKEGGDSHGSVVKWFLEYEKAKEDAPAPIAYIEALKRATKDLNIYVQKHI